METTQKQISVLEDENGNYSEVARHIFGLCNKTLPAMQNEFFAKWYLTAFPEKNNLEFFDDIYCLQWISRFATGTPSIFMDRQRLKAYFEVAIAWNDSKLIISEDKTKVLLEWDDKKGRFKEYILNKSLQQPNDDTEYFVETQFIGYQVMPKSAKLSQKEE